MKQFKFLRENKPLSSFHVYDEIAAAIVQNQHRNGFNIIGAQHSFRMSGCHYVLSVEEHLRAARIHFITYKVENMTRFEDANTYVLEMSDYWWNRIIES